MAITVLLFFVSFLSIPTIISTLDKDADVSIAFNMNEEEEENHASYKEIFPDVYNQDFNPFALYTFQKLGLLSAENSLNFDPIHFEIPSPPPEVQLV